MEQFATTDPSDPDRVIEFGTRLTKPPDACTSRRFKWGDKVPPTSMSPEPAVRDRTLAKVLLDNAARVYH